MVSPPLQAPGPTPSPMGQGPPAFTAPVVESYDEETYRCQPNDTMRSICLKMYHSEKYERALLLFNRSHPMASEGVKQDPPVLEPNTPIFIPPLRILEKRYPHVIPDLTPLPPPGTPPMPPVGLQPSGGTPAGTTLSPAPVPAPSPGTTSGAFPTTPAPLPSAGGSFPAVPTPMPQGPNTPGAATSVPAPTPAPIQGSLTSFPGPSGTRRYKVRPSGETFIEIAQRTLGNPNRWREIAQLNPNYPPNYPIPSGSLLLLPGDARIDPADAP
ncbi:MAG: hypothetical protein NZ700_03700 [Gemmataceae bacterium]|nr:hypothetical protein [Gemmataceae bacterium]MDW8264959.1 hypothetical protein [Gemmataceae bacterium]